MLSRTPSLGVASLAAWHAATLLTACGGGSGASPPELLARNDSVSLSAGEHIDLLANDTLGGTRAVAGAGGNVTFTLLGSTPGTPVVVDANGVASLGSATTAITTTTLSYRICEDGNPGHCAEAVATIAAPSTALVAHDDSFAAVQQAGVIFANVLDNDRYGSALAYLHAKARIVDVSGPAPQALTLRDDGTLELAAAIEPGDYRLRYQACLDAAPATCATATAYLTVHPSRDNSAVGRVVDHRTEADLADVAVRVAGDGSASTKTDFFGTFWLHHGRPADARQTLLFTAPGYATGARVIPGANGKSEVSVRLQRWDTVVDVNPQQPVDVSSTAGPARVQLSADSIRREDGSALSGLVNLRLTPIDPRADVSVMPGELMTMVGQLVKPIETFGALNLDLAEKSSGGTLQIAAAQSAVVRIPVATRASVVPATAALYRFDPMAGTWVQDGSATLAGSSAGRHYEGRIARTGTWSAGRLLDAVRVTGCVTPLVPDPLLSTFQGNFKPAAFASGFDYSGSMSARIAGDGLGNLRFGIDVPRGGTALVDVDMPNNLAVSARPFGPFSSDTVLDTCIAMRVPGVGITIELPWQIPIRFPVPQPAGLLITPNGEAISIGRPGRFRQHPYAANESFQTGNAVVDLMTIERLMQGTYRYLVYTLRSNGLDTWDNRTVNLGIPGRPVQTFRSPSPGASAATGPSAATKFWLVFELTVDAQCKVSVRETAGFLNAQPTPAPSVPIYCIPP